MLISLENDGVKFDEKDIYSIRELHTKYWDKIPVLLKNDHELLWPFTLEEVLALVFITGASLFLN